MTYILLGVLGIIIVYFCDFLAIKRIPYIKPIMWVFGWSLLVYTMVMASLWPDKIVLPGWVGWVGWILLVVSILLIVHAIFVSLPFRKTYIATGAGEKLVTTGFYALVRHPWLHWSILLLISLILVSRSRLVLFAATPFVLLEVISVSLQEYFFLRRIFYGYERYRKETPMLIPNRKSIKNFFNSLKQKSPHPRAAGGHNDVELI